MKQKNGWRTATFFLMGVFVLLVGLQIYQENKTEQEIVYHFFNGFSISDAELQSVGSQVPLYNGFELCHTPTGKCVRMIRIG